MSSVTLIILVTFVAVVDGGRRRTLGEMERGHKGDNWGFLKFSFSNRESSSARGSNRPVSAFERFVGRITRLIDKPQDGSEPVGYIQGDQTNEIYAQEVRVLRSALRYKNPRVGDEIEFKIGNPDTAKGPLAIDVVLITPVASTTSRPPDSSGPFPATHWAPPGEYETFSGYDIMDMPPHDMPPQSQPGSYHGLGGAFGDPRYGGYGGHQASYSSYGGYGDPTQLKSSSHGSHEYGAAAGAEEEIKQLLENKQMHTVGIMTKAKGTMQHTGKFSRGLVSANGSMPCPGSQGSYEGTQGSEKSTPPPPQPAPTPSQHFGSQNGIDSTTSDLGNNEKLGRGKQDDDDDDDDEDDEEVVLQPEEKYSGYSGYSALFAQISPSSSCFMSRPTAVLIGFFAGSGVTLAVLREKAAP